MRAALGQMLALLLSRSSPKAVRLARVRYYAQTGNASVIVHVDSSRPVTLDKVPATEGSLPRGRSLCSHDGKFYENQK